MLILFVVVGCYATVGRFIHDAALRRSTSYGVTDQRLLFLRNSKFASLDISRLPKLELSESRDRTGSINFDSGPSFFNYGRSGGFDLWVPSLVMASQFYRISDPRHVYELIRTQPLRAT